jgi:hypothetical protein
MINRSALCAFLSVFAPLREKQFSQRREVKTEGVKEDEKRFSKTL